MQGAGQVQLGEHREQPPLQEGPERAAGQVLQGAGSLLQGEQRLVETGVLLQGGSRGSDTQNGRARSGSRAELGGSPLPQRPGAPLPPAALQASQPRSQTSRPSPARLLLGRPTATPRTRARGRSSSSGPRWLVGRHCSTAAPVCMGGSPRMDPWSVGHSNTSQKASPPKASILPALCHAPGCFPHTCGQSRSHVGQGLTPRCVQQDQSAALLMGAPWGSQGCAVQGVLRTSSTCAVCHWSPSTVPP